MMSPSFQKSPCGLPRELSPLQNHRHGHAELFAWVGFSAVSEGAEAGDNAVIALGRISFHTVPKYKPEF